MESFELRDSSSVDLSEREDWRIASSEVFSVKSVSAFVRDA